MFNSRFLKNSSYAVLSASVVSMAQGANGFANMELDNQGAAFENSGGENIFSSPLKQEELKIDVANSVYEIEDLKRLGLYLVCIPVVFFIVYIVVCIFLPLKLFFNCGTEKFQKLDFRKKIEMLTNLKREIDSLKKIVFKEESFEAIVKSYSTYFDLKRTFELMGLNFEETKKEVEEERRLTVSLIGNQ